MFEGTCSEAEALSRLSAVLFVTMPTGRMLRWNAEKGFGFIKPDDDSPDASAGPGER